MASLFLQCSLSLEVGMENYVPMFNTLHSLAERSAVVRKGKLWGLHKLLAQVSQFSKCFKTSHNTAERKTIGMHYFDTKITIVTVTTGDCKMLYRSLLLLYSYHKILHNIIIIILIMNRHFWNQNTVVEAYFIRIN
jgi:hypothetical protein